MTSDRCQYYQIDLYILNNNKKFELYIIILSQKKNTKY